MRVNFRQGIVSAQTSFLSINGSGNVDLVASNRPVRVTLAHKDTNYLFDEPRTVTNAWTGPFTSGVSYWLYWEFDQLTFERTFGKTTLEPLVQGTEPTAGTDSNGQAILQDGRMWFDTTNFIHYVYQGGSFTQVLRVFAAKLIGTASLISASSNPNFTGTQIEDNSSVFAGRVLFDETGTAITKSNNTFLTTESGIFTRSSRVDTLRLESNSIRAQSAQSNIAQFTPVAWNGDGTVLSAKYDDIGKTVVGVMLEDTALDEIGNVLVQGTITNPIWNWTGGSNPVDVGAPLWIDNNGVFVTVDPHVSDVSTHPTKRVPIARVLSSDTIIFEQGLGGVGPQGPQGPSGTSSPATTSDIGAVRLTTIPTDPLFPLAVADTDPRLVDSRTPLPHSHSASDISLLPSGNITSNNVQAGLIELDSKKVAKTGDTMTGLLTLSGDPTANFHAATKQYVDTVASIDIEDSGSSVVPLALGINFNTSLDVIDDGDDTVTVNLGVHTHTLADITDSGSAAALGVTGLDANAVTGTAGTNGNLIEWNIDGDAVDSGSSTGDFSLVGHTHTKSEITDFTESDYVHTFGVESIDGDKTFGDDIIIEGNLTVNGTTTTLNTAELDVADNIIRLNSDFTGSPPVSDAGIEVERGTATNASVLWDESEDVWKVGLVGSETEISVTGHTHDTADITSGTFADARIAESNVTQHEAALSLTASQVIEISNLTAAEGAQLENIDAVTITNTQWGYLGSLDQSLATTDAVTFATVDTGNGAFEINAAAEKGVTGLDANAVTGTAGTNGNITEWNIDGDLVDAGIASANVLTDITNEPIGDLLDVTIATPADNEVLAFDNGTSTWINQTAAEAGLAVDGHTHDTADITSGTFADARIAQSNVTQHEAALSLTASQVTEISNLTAAEGAQLENIDSVTITNTQWGHLGGLSSSPLEDNDLAANGGTIPETDRANVFTDLIDIKRDGTQLRIFDSAAPDVNDRWQINYNIQVLSFIWNDDSAGVLTTVIKFFDGSGVNVGSPTGGDQGFGTINAEGVYQNGSLVLDSTDLAANGGTIPETDQVNVFTAVQQFGGTALEVTSNIVRSDGPLILIGDSNNNSGGQGVEIRVDGATAAATLIARFDEGGAEIGSPTGGSQGSGTINAEGVYNNGVLTLDQNDLAANGGTIPETDQNNVFTVEQRLQSVSPQIAFIETDAAVDNGRWLLQANSEQFTIRAVNDAANVFTQALAVNRTGTTVDFVTFPNSDVGIGTSTPADVSGLNTTVLHISGARAGLVLEDDGATSWQLSSDNGDLNFYEDTTKHAFFDSAGAFVVGSPTGGSQGSGTINAVGVYENGTNIIDQATALAIALG